MKGGKFYVGFYWDVVGSVISVYFIGLGVFVFDGSIELWKKGLVFL